MGLYEAVTQNWDKILVVMIAFSVFMKNLRDAIDKTPDTDDNVFEKLVSIIGKVVVALTTGKRPQA